MIDYRSILFSSLPSDKTLNDCPHEDVACLYPLSCCFSVECTEYRLAELNIEGDRFHDRWYKSNGELTHNSYKFGQVTTGISERGLTGILKRSQSKWMICCCQPIRILEKVSKGKKKKNGTLATPTSEKKVVWFKIP